MRYILYTYVTYDSNGITVSCHSVPHSIAALIALVSRGAHILGTNLTEQQCMNKALQHSLAIDAFNYSSN
jgi:hypothetical protein